MRFSIAGEGALARGCAEAIAGRADWSVTAGRPDYRILCGPASEYAHQAAAAARQGIRCLCPTPMACGESDGELLLSLARSGMVSALRLELQRPHVPGLRRVLDGAWLGPVGTVNLVRKKPLGPGVDRCGGALAQCAMEEVSALVWLLGPPRRVFCVRTDLGEGEHVSLTLQHAGGALVNIQAVLGGHEAPYFSYEYAGRDGLADYDSRRGALNLSGGKRRMPEPEWTAGQWGAALDAALETYGDNGATELLRVQLAALRAARERRVVELEEVKA